MHKKERKNVKIKKVKGKKNKIGNIIKKRIKNIRKPVLTQPTPPLGRAAVNEGDAITTSLADTLA